MISKCVCTLATLASLTAVNGFQSLTPAFLSSHQSGIITTSPVSKTVLYISSWGSGSSGKAPSIMERENPRDNVQGYLPAPEAVEARNSVDGSCLVSGLVKTFERTDQTLFDLVNHEESAFEFDKIVAFVDDVKFSKKRLLSRSARYTGLLDKLEFVQAATPGALPTAEQIMGVKTWVANIAVDEGTDAKSFLEQVQSIAETSKGAPDLLNVAIILSNASGLDEDTQKSALETLKSINAENDKKVFTLVAVGKLEEHAEGSVPYKTAEFGSADGVIKEDAVFSREESLRMITELLQLESGSNRALTFTEVQQSNATEAKLVKGLRQAGYARPQEIDHIIRDGVQKYVKAVDEFLGKNPDAGLGYTTDAWWEAEEFQKSVRKIKERDEKKVIATRDERQEEVDVIAKEWAKREFFRQSMADTTQLSEEEFIKEVWDRALLEGDLKYRQMKGEIVDAESELADFKAQQERKAQTMLKRAKDELNEILESEDLGKVDNLPGEEPKV